MSSDPSNAKPTELYQTLQAVALEAYGSLLSGPLADKAATAFADEASAMLEAMLADHTQALRERIDAQLSGMTLGKGPKRKANKTPAPAPNEAMNGEATNGATPGQPIAAAAPEEAKPAKADGRSAKVEAKSTRPRKRAGGRSSARS